MAASTYDEALRRLLAHEGGYTDHPSDPGGPTKYGITIHDYRKHVMPGATAADVKAMTLAAAKSIYRTKYWDAQRCDELPVGVDYSVFDYGVNSGIGRAGKVLRRICGLPDRTHIVDDEVLTAVRSRDPAMLVRAINDERLAFLKRLKTWPVFGKGWGRRVAEVRAASLAMAAAKPAQPSAGTAAGKSTAPLSRTAQQTAAGVIVAAGAAAAQQAHQAGARSTAVIAIGVATLVLAAAGWLWWRRRQRLQRES
jgi:lysozyme family protein